MASLSSFFSRRNRATLCPSWTASSSIWLKVIGPSDSFFAKARSKERLASSSQPSSSAFLKVMASPPPEGSAARSEPPTFLFIGPSPDRLEGPTRGYRPEGRAGKGDGRNYHHGGAARAAFAQGRAHAAAFGFPPWLSGVPPALPALIVHDPASRKQAVWVAGVGVRGRPLREEGSPPPRP